MSRNALILAALAACFAGLSVWLTRETNLADQAGAPQRGNPDYYMENFSAITMNKDGTPRQRLEAARMNHFPEGDTVEVTTPHLLFNQAEGNWHLFADTGWMEGDLIFLRGNVRMEREGAQPVVITTETLKVNPEKEFAETSAPLTIRDGQTVIDAVGMTADMSTRHVVLQSQVRGTYEP